MKKSNLSSIILSFLLLAPGPLGCGESGSRGFVATDGAGATCPNGEEECVNEKGEVCTAGVCSCPVGHTCIAAEGTGGSSASGGSVAGSGGMSTLVPTNSGGTAGTGGSVAVLCTNILPDAGTGVETCANWAEWGECGAQWMAGKCDESCGRCQNVSTGDGDGDVPGDGDGDLPGEPDSRFPPLSGGDQAYSTRYWDCCKPSCGWSDRPNTVDSCDSNGNNIGVNDGVSSSCNGGEAQTCHGMAPWAKDSQLAFGFVAANGRQCGSCYQLQFTGQGNSNPNEPGSVAIKGKTLVVMVTNTGGELGDGHFDFLIPGGGLGQFNGCTRATGIPASDMGETYGGFIADCSDRASQEARKECVRERCQSVFGSRGLSDLEAGCLWSADWFEAADNPKFLFKEVDCPSELRGYN